MLAWVVHDLEALSKQVYQGSNLEELVILVVLLPAVDSNVENTQNLQEAITCKSSPKPWLLQNWMGGPDILETGESDNSHSNG